MKRARKQERYKGTIKQPEINEQNGNKSMYINNFFKHKWTKFSNQKTKSG